MSLIIVKSFEKDSADDVDYSLNYATAPWLAQGDTITSSSWAVIGGDGALQMHDASFTTTTATTWVRGGTVGVTYTLANTISTANAPARSVRRALSIKILG
jgi:hypothetical protein